MVVSSGFLSLLILASIHLFGNQIKAIGWIWHGRFLSFAAGISFAYVFVDLLPTLEKGQPILKHAFGEMIPYLDKHVYLIALLGVLFYYGIHTQSEGGSKRNFWVGLGGYLLFNFFMGASLSDSTDPDIQPLVFFTFAMGMHYFIHDHNTDTHNPILFQSLGRWLLIAALFIGYGIGYLTHIPETVEVIVISFIAGGVFLNALRYELPKRNQVGYGYFAFGALFFTALLLYPLNP